MNGASTARLVTTPFVRRLATTLGVDLRTVAGSGPSGRLTRHDVERAAGAQTSPEELTSAERPIAVFDRRDDIARRMLRSLRTTAQLTLVREVDVTAAIVSSRAQLPHGGSSITGLVLRALSLALTQHPTLNATFEDDLLTLHPRVHFCVTTPVGNEQVIAVIADAETKSSADLSFEAEAITVDTRDGTSDIGGGSHTFNVLCLGPLGIDAFTPIIDPPAVAALGIGRVRETLTRSSTGLQWRSLMTLSLTIDHQVVDGSVGARLLDGLATTLADVELLW